MPLNSKKILKTIYFCTSNDFDSFADVPPRQRRVNRNKLKVKR
jgi:hypothetical protein